MYNCVVKHISGVSVYARKDWRWVTAGAHQLLTLITSLPVILFYTLSLSLITSGIQYGDGYNANLSNRVMRHLYFNNRSDINIYIYIYVLYLAMKSETAVNVRDKESVFGRVFNFNTCMIAMHDQTLTISMKHMQLIFPLSLTM